MLTFTRNDDGTYTRAGSLPKGTRKVRIVIDGRPAHAKAASEALALLEESERKGQLRAFSYKLIPENGQGIEAGTALRLELARLHKWWLTATDAEVAATVAWG